MKMQLSCGCCVFSCYDKWQPRDELERDVRPGSIVFTIESQPLNNLFGGAMQFPLDGMPTGPLTLAGGDISFGVDGSESQQGMGYFNINSNAVRMSRWCDWDDQQMHSHTFDESMIGQQLDVLMVHGGTGEPLGLPINFPDNGVETPNCYRQRVAYSSESPPITRSTSHGLSYPVDEVLITFDNVPARPGPLVFNRRKCVAVEGYNRISGDTKFDTKVWLYYNNAVGTDPVSINSVPIGAWTASYTIRSMDPDGIPGIHDFTYENAVAGIPTTVTPSDLWTGGDGSYVHTRPNIVPGDSDTTRTESLDIGRIVYESLSRSTEAIFLNGVVTFDPITEWSFDPTFGRTTVELTQDADPWVFTGPGLPPVDAEGPEVGCPENLYTTGLGGSIGLEIVVSEELPELCNSDPTKGVYIALLWPAGSQGEMPAAGTIEEIPDTVVTGTQLESGLWSSGKYHRTHYLGTVDVTFGATLDSENKPPTVNEFSDEAYVKASGYTSDPDSPQRSTWKNPDDFTWPLHPETEGTAENIGGTDSPYTTVDGIVVQQGGIGSQAVVMETTTPSSEGYFTRSEVGT